MAFAPARVAPAVAQRLQIPGTGTSLRRVIHLRTISGEQVAGTAAG